MKIAVTGASGLVGSELVHVLESKSHSIVRLVRSGSKNDAVIWDPTHGIRQPKLLEGIDALVHLAGDDIAQGRWTPQKKESIRYSRVQGTQSLCRSLVSLERPPQTLICASATGFYGDRRDEILTEESGPGNNFLANTCQQWEQASSAAAQKGIRVIHLRFGIILSRKGGALTKMLPPFRMGVGGAMGSGRQYWSWIDIADAVGVIEFALTHSDLKGPVNVVSPAAPTNQEFTQALGKVLHRPTVFPLPAFVARLIFGQMADELLLASCRVQPKRLLNAGYRFQYPNLEESLRRHV